VNRRQKAALKAIPSDPLDQIVLDIQDQRLLLDSASFTGLGHAFRLGELLIQAKDMTQERGLGWEEWADKHLAGLKDRTRRHWMRLARHRREIETQGIRTISDAEAFLKDKLGEDGGEPNATTETQEPENARRPHRHRDKSLKQPRHALEDHLFGCRRMISKVQSDVEIDNWVLDPFLEYAIKAMHQDADLLHTLAADLERKAKPDVKPET